MRRPNRSWCAASFVCVGGWVLAAGAALALPIGFTDVRIQSPQVTDGEFFGRSVASLGTRLVVGAPGSSYPDFSMLPGRVYVLGLDGIAELVIENPTPASGDEFGAAVSVASGNIAVGAPFDDTVDVDAGAAYVFDGTTGALLHTLLVPGSGANDQCGRAVATLGSDVLVLCDGVYRFDGSTGALVQHYTATGCLGGRGLATIAGDVLSAGYSGTICRFDGATGAVVQTYVDPEPGLFGLFGSSIGVDGNVVVVGGELFSGTRESAYVYDGTTGVLEQTIRGPYYGTPYNAGFGSSVAAAGGVLVGSGWNSALFYDGVPPALVGAFQPENFSVNVSRDSVTAVFGTSFALWTDTIKPNVGRGSITLIDACGNGVLSPAEQCDDGNTTGGDGCSATCRLEGCPTTFPVACHSTLGGSSTVSVQKRSPGLWAVNGDRFVWKWKGASALTDFGDPTVDATYQLCFYDDLFGTPDLQFDLAIPAGGLCAGKPCWQAKGASRFGYADRDLTPSGIEKVTIRAQGGKAKIAVSGKGARLGLPPVVGPDDTLPFNFGWAVVMVDSGSGQCWVAGSGASKNSGGKFKGTAGGS